MCPRVTRPRNTQLQCPSNDFIHLTDKKDAKRTVGRLQVNLKSQPLDGGGTEVGTAVTEALVRWSAFKLRSVR